METFLHVMSFSNLTQNQEKQNFPNSSVKRDPLSFLGTNILIRKRPMCT